MTSNQFTLVLNAATSDLIDPEGKIYSMFIGLNELSHKLFKSDRPTSLELEYAIESIENCVMPLDKQLPANRSILNISNETPDLFLEDILVKGQLINLDEYEDLFNKTLTQERPGKIIASLLIIRECLHHLRFTCALLI